jgi:hypothetical protein
VSWSVERRVPRRVRPSTVMTTTFSVCMLGHIIHSVLSSEAGHETEVYAAR